MASRWQRRTRWQPSAMVAIFVALALLPSIWPRRDVPYNWLSAQLGARPLLTARSWHYQLTDATLDELLKSDADLMVIDYATHKGHVPLAADDVARLKRKPNGRPRIVVAYMSIGEAETWRWYWRPEWQAGSRPSWAVTENCAWPGAYMVRFWQDGWRDIIYRGERPYLRRIVDAGFDGVYLDRVDIWEQHIKERPTARAEMIAFVEALAATARRWKPGFLVLPQNADHLLSDRGYRNAIDGLGKEDLLYGTAGSDIRSAEKDIAWSKHQLSLLLADYKPVFAVEYPTVPDNIANAKAELGSLGIVVTVQHRSLNGANFVTETRHKEDIEGTPEWIADKCKDKRWW
jgi:cysteinyl-tRNA synthetase, unknown class